MTRVGLLQPGGRGELFNLSQADGDPSDPFDPAKPTIVITHGLNPSAWLVRFVYPQRMAEAIRSRFPGRFNLAAWDWNSGAFGAPHPLDAKANAIAQGRMLAWALRLRGAGEPMHLIGHSLGGLVVTSAACELGGVDQITLLDSMVTADGRVFGALRVTDYARCVDNYYAPLPTGYGRPVAVHGVINRKVTESPSERVFPLLTVAIRGHVNVMLWYLDTVRDPSLPAGFNRSVLLKDTAD
jgi:pimeloyl-ACP methyl ester carboxylesterase